MFYHFQDRDENPRIKLLQNENVKRGENTKPLEGGEEVEEKGGIHVKGVYLIIIIMIIIILLW